MGRIFSIGSMNAAIRARRHLARAMINSEVVKVDQRYSQNGCEYGIRFSARDLYAVVHVLVREGIVYYAYDDGHAKNGIS